MIVTKARTFRNVLYATATKGATLLCAVATTMVVARNLTPRDYGVVGFATIVIGFLLQFTDMGLARAAIRRRELPPESLDTVFTLKAILGCLAFVAALLIAPFARHFIDHPASSNVIRILALDFVGKPLAPEWGAPVRLRIPTKLGFKSAKNIKAISVTNTYPGGYWEDQGYNWFSGS